MAAARRQTADLALLAEPLRLRLAGAWQALPEAVAAGAGRPDRTLWETWGAAAGMGPALAEAHGRALLAAGLCRPDGSVDPVVAALINRENLRALGIDPPRSAPAAGGN